MNRERGVVIVVVFLLLFLLTMIAVGLVTRWTRSTTAKLFALKLGTWPMARKPVLLNLNVWREGERSDVTQTLSRHKMRMGC